MPMFKTRKPRVVEAEQFIDLNRLSERFREVVHTRHGLGPHVFGQNGVMHTVQKYDWIVVEDADFEDPWVMNAQAFRNEFEAAP